MTERHYGMSALRKMPHLWPGLRDRIQGWALSNDHRVRHGASEILEPLDADTGK